jgi:hypothetical protein
MIDVVVATEVEVVIWAYTVLEEMTNREEMLVVAISDGEGDTEEVKLIDDPFDVELIEAIVEDVTSGQ